MRILPRRTRKAGLGLALGILAALPGCRDEPRAEATPRGTAERPAEPRRPSEALGEPNTPGPSRQAPEPAPPGEGHPRGAAELRRSGAGGADEAGEPDERRLRIYYPSSKLAGGDQNCTEVFPVERPWPGSAGVARAALEALLAGPTPEERKAGYHSALPEDARLGSVRVDGGVATVDFEVLDLAGSCAVRAARAQIERTLEQFPTVRSVVVELRGSATEALQP